MLAMIHLRLARLLRHFRRDERGVIAIETVVITPLLLSGLLFSFAFYDVHLQQSVRDKATYTMTDALSRETGVIDDTYIDNLKTVFDMLAGNRGPTQMRVSVVRFHDMPGNQSYELRWSEVRGTGPLAALTQDEVTADADRLPLMVGGQDLILVETRGDYVPLVATDWVNGIVIETRMFMTLRFASQLCFEGVCTPVS
jgi:hypothetical protein